MTDELSDAHASRDGQFGGTAARKAERRKDAERERDRGIWFSLGLFGLVGWSVALPTLIGIGVGVLIDARWPGRVSWTLTLLFLGMAIGCLNAWRWISHESRDR